MLKDMLPDSHIVLLALTPRGGGGSGPRFFQWPSVFTQPFEVVNAHFRCTMGTKAHVQIVSTERVR
jgi:hypothetical protein